MKKITCIVDNAVKPSSPFWGEHGLAFQIETEEGWILFDTGQSGAVLAHNLGQLEANQNRFQGVILSHAHIDHTGGLPVVLSKFPGLPLYAHPDIFRSRFSQRQTNQYRSIGLALTEAELARQADLRIQADPVEVLPGLWTTGEISERPELEGRGPNHVVPAEDGWQPDPYRDDMSMVLEVETGLVVICGCCHAGLLNTLAHVRRLFQQPIITVMGGTHLVSADADYLEHVIQVLQSEYGTLDFYLNHCTGEQAYLALASAFGSRVHTCPAGTILNFT